MPARVLHFDAFSARPGMGNPETIHPEAHLHRRHFSSPRSGTVEDPVTGTTSGVLGAYHLEFIEAGAASPLLVEQGQEIGRDGRVRVWVDQRDGRYHPRVGGTGRFVRELAIESARA